MNPILVTTAAMCGLLLSNLTVAAPASDALLPQFGLTASALPDDSCSSAALQLLFAELKGLADNTASKAQLGIAVIMDGESLFINNHFHYPLMSVMKLHQALAVLHYLKDKQLTLDDEVYITKADLLPNTYSPLRDKYPQGELCLSYRELLRYTLQLSDNNACDILFKQLGGPAYVDAYLRAQGLDDVVIKVNEDDMHRDLDNCYANWSTPLATAQLCESLLSSSNTLAVRAADLTALRELLMTSPSGPERLSKGLAGSKAQLGHKTGTSDLDAFGRYIGVNDIGFVLLPDGRHYCISVFVTDAALSLTDAEALIAKVSALTLAHLSATSAP